jgi:ATP-binding cassette, subfamily D (ALD), peroxisomal long-chain fatty acid import protein
LKKYHAFNLVLGLGEQNNEWAFERIGTEQEKLAVDREIQDLKEQLSQVDEWKSRREAIESELAKVWIDSGEALDPPTYTEAAADSSQEQATTA